jgi:hypothetical protein
MVLLVLFRKLTVRMIGLYSTAEYSDGCKPRIFNREIMYDIINENRFNQNPPIIPVRNVKQLINYLVLIFR